MFSWKYYDPSFEYEKKFQDIYWAWAGHKRFAYDLVRNFRPQKIAELGTHKGTSFFSFCQAIKDSGTNAELNAIDTWTGDQHSGFYDESVYYAVKDIQKLYYPKINIRLHRKKFDDAITNFKDDSIDLLHIDGLHTYSAVKHDFDSWYGKVNKKGIILFHDINVKTGDFGVYKLWQELKDNVKIEFYHSNGLGILFKDQEQAENMGSLQKHWQQYYASLYENNILKNRLIEKNKENIEISFQLNQKNKELEHVHNSLLWKIIWATKNPKRLIQKIFYSKN